MTADQLLNEKLENAIWIARSLFDRGKTAGASANLSFRHNSFIYITATNSCFGRLTAQDFSRITEDGTHMDGPKPSKEYPMHIKLYQKSERIGAVIHTQIPVFSLPSYPSPFHFVSCCSFYYKS